MRSLKTYRSLVLLDFLVSEVGQLLEWVAGDEDWSDVRVNEIDLQSLPQTVYDGPIGDLGKQRKVFEPCRLARLRLPMERRLQSSTSKKRKKKHFLRSDETKALRHAWEESGKGQQRRHTYIACRGSSLQQWNRLNNERDKPQKCHTISIRGQCARSNKQSVRSPMQTGTKPCRKQIKRVIESKVRNYYGINIL